MAHRIAPIAPATGHESARGEAPIAPATGREAARGEAPIAPATGREAARGEAPIAPVTGRESARGKLLRTLRLDPSDTLIFPAAAEPGEWAVPGGFQFWDDAPDSLAGKRQQAFRSGFLGLASFGRSTLVEVAEVTPEAREAALESLAAHIQAEHGAPDREAARAAAAEELAFAESLCDQPPGTVFALHRSHDEAGEIREAFRTLHRRETPHHDFGALPVFAIAQVEEEAPPDSPDLTALIKANSFKVGK